MRDRLGLNRFCGVDYFLAGVRAVSGAGARAGGKICDELVAILHGMPECKAIAADAGLIPAAIAASGGSAACLRLQKIAALEDRTRGLGPGAP